MLTARQIFFDAVKHRSDLPVPSDWDGWPPEPQEYLATNLTAYPELDRAWRFAQLLDGSGCRQALGLRA